jgi:protein ImuB
VLGPEAVMTAVLKGGRGFAEQIRLVAWGDSRDSGEESGRRGGRPPESPPPWPGRLSKPSPAVVHKSPRPADLCDAGGNPVKVSGRGVISSGPAALTVEGGAWVKVVAWAGPWPLEERWWESGGRRRARLQVLLEGGEALLVARESGRWWVEASYE